MKIRFRVAFEDWLAIVRAWWKKPIVQTPMEAWKELLRG